MFYGNHYGEEDDVPYIVQKLHKGRLSLIPTIVETEIKLKWKQVTGLTTSDIYRLVSFPALRAGCETLPESFHVDIKNLGECDVYAFNESGDDFNTYKSLPGSCKLGVHLEISVIKTAPLGSKFAEEMGVSEKAPFTDRVFKSIYTLKSEDFDSEHGLEDKNIFFPDINLIFSTNEHTVNLLTPKSLNQHLADTINYPEYKSIDVKSPITAWCSDPAVAKIFYSTDGNMVQTIPVYTTDVLEPGQLVVRYASIEESRDNERGYIEKVDVKSFNVKFLNHECAQLYDTFRFSANPKVLFKDLREHPLVDKTVALSDDLEEINLPDKVKELEKENEKLERNVGEFKEDVDRYKKHLTSLKVDAADIIERLDSKTSTDITSKELKAFCGRVTCGDSPKEILEKEVKAKDAELARLIKEKEERRKEEKYEQDKQIYKIKSVKDFVSTVKSVLSDICSIFNSIRPLFGKTKPA